MNIKNRIRKIEDELRSGENFCRCAKDIVIKVEPRDETGELPPPDICQDCGKEMSRFIPAPASNIETEIMRPAYRVIEPGDDLQERRNLI